MNRALSTERQQNRLMLHYLCQELTRQECDTLKFMCERDIPRARLESIQGPQDFFRVLESQHKLSAESLDYLLHRLRHLNRQDLVRKAEQFRNTHQSAHLSTADDVYSENIAVSLKSAATHDYRKDDADVEENFAPRDVLVRQHQQLRRQTDCQIEDNRTTVDERTIHLTSRQMETGLLLNRESDGDLRQSVGISGEVFNSGRRNGVQGSRNHDADMPCYSMRRKPRGICLIISNEKFYQVGGDPCSTQMPNREGTRVDQENLEATFRNLDFVVECFLNLTHDEMTAELQRMSRTDHSSYDCFVCCILSHGTLGSVYGVNGKTASIRDLMSCVKPAYCPTLRDKPKIFFIQACQGSEKQGGFDVETDSSDIGSPETIPNEADFLLGLATVPGFVSYRSRSQGSWYITTLVRLLEQYAYSHDLLTILTRVNYDVSRAYTKDGGNKQVPQPAYTLRKRLLFQ